jgi:hypothetical protein
LILFGKPIDPLSTLSQTCLCQCLVHSSADGTLQQVVKPIRTINKKYRFVFFLAWLWYSLALLSTLNGHSGYHFPLLPSPEAQDFHHLKFTQCYRHIKIFKICLFVFFSLVVVLFGLVVYSEFAFRLSLPALPLTQSPIFPSPQVYTVLQILNSIYFLCFLAWLWYSLALLSTLNAHSGYHFPSPEAHNLYHLKFTLCYRHLTQTFFVAFLARLCGTIWPCCPC